MAARSIPASRRRTIDLVVLVIVAVVLAVGTFFLARAADGERVAQLWATATIAEDGSAEVVEVIDYDFGTNDRHGILRDVPGLRTSAPVEVSSPDAPDQVTLSEFGTPELRIGDPNRTVTGLHRYVIRYTLDGVAPGGRIGWDAVGTGWDVPIDVAEVHVLAPAELTASECVAGSSGSTDECAARTAAPGHLASRVEGLSAGEGVTVYASAAAPLDTAPAMPDLPAAAPPRAGTDPWVPALLAGALALLAALAVSSAVRRAGQERVPAYGLPVTTGPGEEARIDFAELAQHATPSATLPRLSPAQGGVLIHGGVANQHKAAWLISEAVAGTVDLESDDDGGKKLRLIRLEPGDAVAGPLLDLAFRGRRELTLGTYDADFATAWTALGRELDGWMRSSGLWDAAADRRARLVRVLGVLGGLVGIGLALLGAWLSADGGALPLILAAVGGALTGAGTSAAVRGWELRVLTPEGSALWLQVESLRQLLAQSPRTAVDQAIATDQLGEFTAWAVALGEAEQWKQLASRASVGGRSPAHTRYLRYATYGPIFVSSCSSTSVKPSSSSGGGGSVGGGAGGGGGGSW